jgi:hypothetical protein
VTSPSRSFFISSILDSSIAADYVVRHIFEDLLKLANWLTGEVDMTHEAISRRINAPVETVRRAIDELEKPDPLSRNRAEGGRRIVRLDPERQWGWKIVNYAHYRDEVRLQGKRERQARHRERTAEKKGRGEEFRRNCTARSARVTEGASLGDSRDAT